MRDGTRDGQDRWPTVTVITVVRNGERYLAEALASITQSRLQPLEILVVDGGSTDRSVEIASRVPGVRVIPQSSSGIANAYNEGIAAARGELVAFLSHDDRWLPGKLDRQVAHMAARPDLLMTFTHVLHVLDGETAPAGFRRELLDGPVPGLIMETFMARPAVFDVVGRFDPAFSVSEDTDWFARARDAGVAYEVLPDVLTEKRVHGTNASLNTPQINALLLRALRQSVERKRSIPTD